MRIQFAKNTFLHLYWQLRVKLYLELIQFQFDWLSWNELQVGGLVSPQEATVSLVCKNSTLKFYTNLRLLRLLNLRLLVKYCTVIFIIQGVEKDKTLELRAYYLCSNMITDSRRRIKLILFLPHGLFWFHTGNRVGIQMPYKIHHKSMVVVWQQ